MLTILAASALKVCVIAYANDRPSTPEIRDHELAHANGWHHPPQNWIVPFRGYVAIKPPRAFIHAPTKCRLREIALPTTAVQALCKSITGRASFGCQWDE